MMKRFAGILVGLMFLMLTPLAHADSALQVAPFPEMIPIGTFYDGTRLPISGSLPADCDVVLRLIGDEAPLKMKIKRKVFGLLWMNRDTVTFGSVPETFLLYTPPKFAESLNAMPKDAPVRQLDLTALASRISVAPSTAENAMLVNELLRLKEKEKIYGVSDTLKYAAPAEGRKNFEADIALPPKLRPGVYKVEACLIQNGTIIERYEHPLKVALDSFPKVLSSLAFGHGALYGVLATLIAVVAGLLTGVLFKGGKGAH